MAFLTEGAQVGPGARRPAVAAEVGAAPSAPGGPGEVDGVRGGVHVHVAEAKNAIVSGCLVTAG